jgi:hypothetical protein
MNSAMARSIAFAGVIAAGALSEALVCEPARADYYAFANTQDLGYAELSLKVGNTTVTINTGGFQGWISNNSFNIGGPLGANSNYMVGVYNNASYNNYFGFNLSALGSTATVTSAKLIIDSGLINTRVNYSLFDATQWISQLEAGSSPNTALYDALETGADVDPTILSPNTTNPTAQLEFTLDESAVTDINTAIRNRTMMFALSGHAELADAVPEPSTWVLMLAGLAGLGLVASLKGARGQGSAAPGRKTF